MSDVGTIMAVGTVRGECDSDSKMRVLFVLIRSSR
jgi:hypothetical protein